MSNIIPLPVRAISALSVVEAYDHFRTAKLREMASPTPENRRIAIVAWRRWQTLELIEEASI